MILNIYKKTRNMRPFNAYFAFPKAEHL
jgi:hypothetical protein